MALFLHNPASQAHLEDLRSRLTAQLSCRSGRVLGRDQARIEHLADVVRAMDQGTITSGQALEVSARDRVPGFVFGRWLVELVDEGIYLDAVYDEVA